MFKAKARRGGNGVPTRATSHCSVVIVRTLAIEKDTVPAVSLLTWLRPLMVMKNVTIGSMLPITVLRPTIHSHSLHQQNAVAQPRLFRL